MWVLHSLHLLLHFFLQHDSEALLEGLLQQFRKLTFCCQQEEKALFRCDTALVPQSLIMSGQHCQRPVKSLQHLSLQHVDHNKAANTCAPTALLRYSASQ